MNNTKSDTGCQEEKRTNLWSRYGHIPYSLMSSPDLDKTAKLIIAYLLTYCGDNSECWPSQETISHDLGLSKRTIRRATRGAQLSGYVRRRHKSKGRGHGSFTVYTISCMESYPFRPATDDRSKFGPAKNGHLDRPNQTHKYKQENKHSYGNSENKSLYDDLRPMDEG